MLPLTVKSKVASFAGVLMTSDSQVRKRDIKGLCDNSYTLPYLTPPHSQKHISLDRESLKRVLKNCDKNAEVEHSIPGGFWQGCGGGRTWFSLRGCLLGV